MKWPDVIIGANTPAITSRAFTASNSPTHAEEPNKPQIPDNQGEAAKTGSRTGASDTNSTKNPRTPGNPELSEADHKQVAELKKIDREVRSHEAAHMAAAGGLAKGAARFSYQKGPDGQLYAVGGEVSIDTSAVAGNPEATLAKANIIRAAALAPADPSSQDRAVAASAAQMAAAARIDIAAENLEKITQEQHPPADMRQQPEAATTYNTIQQNPASSTPNGSLFNATA